LIDNLKPLFGIAEIGEMQIVKSGELIYIVANDCGHGMPYEVIKYTSTLGELTIVDKTKTGAQMLRTYFEHNKLTDSEMWDLTKIGLFRWIFGVSDTHANNILMLEKSSGEKCLLSVDESQMFVRKVKSHPDSLMNYLFTIIPKKHICDYYKPFLEANMSKVKNTLETWKDIIFSDKVKLLFGNNGFDWHESKTKIDHYYTMIYEYATRNI